MPGAILLPILLAVVAGLFACVGQAGGAGYVAVMGLFGFDAATIKTTALTLTVLVAAIGVFRFARMGLLRVRDWLAFALLGVPCSLLGGAVNLPVSAYRIVVAVLLFAAAVQMVRRATAAETTSLEEPPFLPALAAGGVIGFAAGITGIGGGIFLAPLMLWRGWAPARRIAATTQVNNLYTGLAALTGVAAAHPVLPPRLLWWALAAGLGGLLGAWAGAKHLPVKAFRYILAAILLVSSLRLAFG